MSDESRTDAKSALGRDNYQKGQTFEERIAQLYRLLRYQVQVGRLFSGRQIDLFLEGRFGDVTLRRAIECKAGQVQASHIDEFVVKLRLVRTEFPDAQGTLVSGVGFTDAVTAHAAREGIQLTLSRDLDGALIDSHGYVRNLVRKIESDTSYPLDIYVDQCISYEPTGEGISAIDVIEDWLQDGSWNQMTVLGDVGTGKSFLSRVLAHRLGLEYLARPNDRPFPMLIDLRNADREFSLEGLIITHASRLGLGQLSFDLFEYLLSQGKIVVLLDGFDEMAARVTTQVTTRNFNELVRAVRGRAKVLLTCRTHYFRSRIEEQQVVLGGQADYASEAARDLYWDLIARRGFRVVYLPPFTLPQIEAYVAKARPADASAAMERIRSTYNLMELSQRPMLLEMIVKSIDALRDRTVTAASLYEVFTNAWIHRDKWRDVLTPEVKQELLIELARVLWQDDIRSVHYTALTEFLKTKLSSDAKDIHTLVEVDHEVRTASFLVRDEQGNYCFAHKSYLEFFLATHLSNCLQQHKFECLSLRRLSPEVLAFLVDMVQLHDVDQGLVDILTSDYRPSISENALLGLYSLRRHSHRKRRSPATADEIGRTQLPEQMQLQGAQLGQVVLESADMIGARLDEAQLGEGVFIGTDFSRGSFVGANLERADLRVTTCRNVVMTNTRLSWANLEKADFSNASLRGATLTDAYISGTVLDGADMAGSSVAWAERSDSDWSTKVSRDARSSTDDSFWEAVVAIMPRLERAARRMLPAHRLGLEEYEDVARDVAVRLASPTIRARFMAHDERGRWLFAQNQLWELLQRKRTARWRAFNAGDIKINIRDDSGGTLVGRLDLEDVEPVVDSFNEAATDAFQRVVISELRERLSPEAWRIFSLYSEGYTLREIGAKTRMSTASVHKLMANVRDILKRVKFNLDRV